MKAAKFLFGCNGKPKDGSNKVVENHISIVKGYFNKRSFQSKYFLISTLLREQKYL